MKRITHEERRVIKRARAEHFASLYRSGQTLEQIGSLHGITRERVRQLLVGIGVTGADGGQIIRRLLTAQEHIQASRNEAQKRERRTLRLYDVTLEQMAAISPLKRADPKHPIMKFRQQKKNAQARGIGWALTFRQWWEIWQASGRWEKRGRGTGYCMARHGDSGPYSPENVYICTCGQNFSDSYITKPWIERFPAGSPSNNRGSPGRGRGWTFVKQCKSRPYFMQIRCRGKHFRGWFATAEEATAAYKAKAAELRAAA